MVTTYIYDIPYTWYYRTANQMMTQPGENLADKMSKRIIDIDLEYGDNVTRAQEVRRVAIAAAEEQYLKTRVLARNHRGKQLQELREEVG